MISLLVHLERKKTLIIIIIIIFIIIDYILIITSSFYDYDYYSRISWLNGVEKWMK